MRYELTLCWLYPRQLSLYGDRGNVIVLLERARLRNVTCRLIQVGLEESLESLNYDIIFMGGGADANQNYIYKDFLEHKKDNLIEYYNTNGVGLFICGAYQLLGKSYIMGDGSVINGLGLADFTTYADSSLPRCVGRVTSIMAQPVFGRCYLVGFENHAGRTYLSSDSCYLSKVTSGFGNNGKDSTEGWRERNFYATYLHGPFLPLNPFMADWLIHKALLNKYGDSLALSDLADDQLIYSARQRLLKKVTYSPI